MEKEVDAVGKTRATDEIVRDKSKNNYINP